MNKHIGVILITILSGVIIFNGLGTNPLWIDEAYFARLVRGDMSRPQEFIPVFIAQLFNLRTEFELRFLAALAGAFTPMAVYYSAKYNKLEWSLFTAVFPLFVFWSHQARPYAFAGLFLVLGWKHGWLNFIAILTTPVALAGTNFIKKKWKIIIPSIILALVVFFMRVDSKDVINSGTITSSRIYYLPALVLVLYASLKQINKKIIYGLIVISLFFFPAYKAGQWYSNEVHITDWRNCGKLDFATNAHVASWYGNFGTWEFKSKLIPFWNARIERGDTLTLGLDIYALISPENLFPEEFLEPSGYAYDRVADF